MGGGNIAIWKHFHINETNPCFPNPADASRNIYIFADPPHLLKLFRNHLIDNGYMWDNNKIDKTPVVSLLNQSSELNITHKITMRHLDLKGAQRQKVKTAVQLISNTVAEALQFCGNRGMLRGEWKATSELIKVMNCWFDVFNSKAPYGKYDLAHGYGLE